jgi:hypothetical protein
MTSARAAHKSRIAAAFIFAIWMLGVTSMILHFG